MSVRRMNAEHSTSMRDITGDLEEAWEELLQGSQESYAETALKELECDLDTFVHLFVADDAPHSLAWFLEESGDKDITTTEWHRPPPVPEYDKKSDNNGTKTNNNKNNDNKNGKRTRKKNAQVAAASKKSKGGDNNDGDNDDDDDDTLFQQRTMEYSHPVNAPLAPPMARARKEQRIRRFGDKGISVETDTYVDDVPLTDCFYVRDRLLVSASEDRVEIALHFDIRFVKGTMFRAIIANTTRREFLKLYRNYYQDMIHVVQQYHHHRHETKKKETPQEEASIQKDLLLPASGSPPRLYRRRWSSSSLSHPNHSAAAASPSTTAMGLLPSAILLGMLVCSSVMQWTTQMEVQSLRRELVALENRQEQMMQEIHREAIQQCTKAMERMIHIVGGGGGGGSDHDDDGRKDDAKLTTTTMDHPMETKIETPKVEEEEESLPKIEEAVEEEEEEEEEMQSPPNKVVKWFWP
eukprot:CAMPEP_0116837724 /NCGR_PEP_ID=MMETSP0418-20121206/8814_1 /TAXON_ID=1158023 /ORGANISM="Astrosyne radiata, Strain 13vi08-1A" /LENGTH=465 /DNA_ID=CAMNT_0004467643 /DNA_START=1 /DNA_END=1397 /DNA_ORIENTATION=+